MERSRKGKAGIDRVMDLLAFHNPGDINCACSAATLAAADLGTGDVSFGANEGVERGRGVNVGRGELQREVRVNAAIKK